MSFSISWSTMSWVLVSGSADLYKGSRALVLASSSSTTALNSSRVNLPLFTESSSSLVAGSALMLYPKSVNPVSANHLRIIRDLRACIACLVLYPYFSIMNAADSVSRSSRDIIPSNVPMVADHRRGRFIDAMLSLISRIL